MYCIGLNRAYTCVICCRAAYRNLVQYAQRECILRGDVHGGHQQAVECSLIQMNGGLRRHMAA
jgi:hypothetical protein